MADKVVDKLIVSNMDVFARKYGATGAEAVASAVSKLIAADAERGIAAAFVDLSDPRAMANHGTQAIPTASAGDPEANKVAIDAVFNHYGPKPAYLMLLGSVDVIPHVRLDNPLAGDGDPDVPSDLPYASDAPYSNEIQDFTSASRIVGRLPNVTNDTKPAYLVGLLNTAATYAPHPPNKYGDFLGISAEVWKKSTAMSLGAIFGSSTGMKISPPNGYKWTNADAKPLAHFVNCHGAPADPSFYGQKGETLYPVAHSASWMNDKVARGTVMAAECCYGAELYDPSLPTAAGQMGMCNTYLRRKAYAYFGSTNIAYGLSEANGQADLICRFFLQQILAGASTGRACLQARLDYIQATGSPLTPFDLKTIAQFNLMADPSLTPVAATSGALFISKSGATGKATEALVARHARLGRRAALAAKAASAIAYRLIGPKSLPNGKKSATLGMLRKLAIEAGMKAPDAIISYALAPAPESAGAKAMVGAAPAEGWAPIAVHAMLEKQESPADAPDLVLIRALQAVEYKDGMDVREFVSR